MNNISGVFPTSMSTGNPSAIHIPSVWDALTENEKRDIRFFKPGKEDIIDVCTSEDSLHSPASKVGSHRSLVITQPAGCTPAHVHLNKEKTYLPQDQSAEACGLIVLAFLNGIWKRYGLSLNHPTIIPPGCPHALMTGRFPANILIAEVWVFLTSKDAKDVLWEPDTERLLKNEHLPRV